MGVADTKDGVRARRPPPRMTGGGSTFFSIIARILTWYTLYTVLFRCPSVPTNDSPTVCHTSYAISKALRPHVYPYYTYISPYVTQYGPYLKRTNEHYIVPVYDSASASYDKFAAPHISRGQAYATKKYETLVKPGLDKASRHARGFYDSHLSPYAAAASELYAKAGPHLARVREYAESFCLPLLIPLYEQSLPYMIKFYEQSRRVVVTVVAPLLRANGEKVVGWGIGVWSDVVKPQVGRIGERLGGTGNGAPAASISAPVFSSLSSANAARATASAESLSSVISSVSTQVSPAKASVSARIAETNKSKQSEHDSERPTKEDVREIIKADLEKWKLKFESAAEKAALDLNVQIDEISDKAQKTKAAHVKEEIDALGQLIGGEFALLKKTVQGLAKLPALDQDSHGDHWKMAEDALLAKTRETGVKIRDKAQSIRVESHQFLANIYDVVAAAAESHLGVLDSVLDVAMQELGMKWAWMDHVTHKDWQRYHKLKDDFEGHKKSVVGAAQRNQKLVDITRWTENDWEGKATELAKMAADELKRLKGVAKRKIEMSDHSDDFSDSGPPAQVVIQGVEDATDASKKIASEVSEEDYDTELNSEHVLGGKEPTPVASSTPPTASRSKGSTWPKLFSGVYAGFVAAAKVEYDDEDMVGEKARSVVGAVNGKLADASKAVFEAIAGSKTTQSPGERYASIASEIYESAFSAASSALYGTPQPAGEFIVSIATDKYSAAVHAASSVIYGTPTPFAQVFAEKARERYSAALSAAEESYSRLLASGENFRSQYDRAVDQAWAAYQSVIDEASSKVQGTPQPTVESILSVAKVKYQVVLSDARRSYDDWYSSASAAVVGTPTPVAGEYAAAATDAAAEKYESIKALVLEAVSGKEQDYIESVMSKFSSLVHGAEQPRMARATSAVGESYESATSAVDSMLTPPPALESIISAANEQVQSAISAASEQIYGTTQGTVESVTSVVGEAYDEAHSRVSEAIHGRETGAIESASAKIANAVSSAKAAISEAVYGTSGGLVERATGTIADTLDAAASAKQCLVDSAHNRLGSAVGAAKGRLNDVVYGTQSGYVEHRTPEVHEKVASSASSAVENPMEKVKEVYETVREEL